ncbi:MAG: OFA family MFS transporter [Vulcanimicrobiaceae bacterium]
MKRWMAAFAGLLCVLGPGALYSFSLTSAPLVAAFGWAPASVTWAFAIANVFLAMGGLVGGLIGDRFGSRPVALAGIVLWSAGYAACSTLGSLHSIVAFYIFYGVIAGFGCGMTYISVLSAILKWYPNARGFGGGLVIMGFGLGSFVYNFIVKPLPQFAAFTSDAQKYSAAQATALADHVPFDVAKYAMDPANVSALMGLFLYSGIAFAVLGIAAALFVAAPTAAAMEATEGATALTPRYKLGEMLSDARFYVLWAMLFLNVFGGVTVLSNMVPIMHELMGHQHDMTGAMSPDPSYIFAFLALFNGFGRLLWGYVSDRISRRVTFAIVLGGQSIAFFILDSSTHDMLFVSIGVALLLLCYGGGFGIMPAFNADFFGTKHFGANYGAQLSAWGLAAVAGVYFTGVMKALSGSFIGLMQPVSIMLLVAMVLPLIIEAPKKIVAADLTPSAT